jgi:hypothetical protein
MSVQVNLMNDKESKNRALLHHIGQHVATKDGGAVIVYVITRKEADEVTGKPCVLNPGFSQVYYRGCIRCESVC